MLSNKNKIPMLQHKDTTNISELNDFFTSSEKVCETVLWIIRSLKLSCKRFGTGLYQCVRRHLWVRTIGQAEWQDGEIVSVSGNIMDITGRKQAQEKIIEQLNELMRWQDVMPGREDRIQELKREVNELLKQSGKPGKYNS